LGADFLGLHAIDRLKPEKVPVFRQIVQEMRDRFPSVGVALLTKVTDIDSVVQMAETVLPTHLQLHAPWEPADLATLRQRLAKVKLPSPPQRPRRLIEVIAMVDPQQPGWADTVPLILGEVDYLLFDHLQGGTGTPIETPLLGEALEQAAGKPAFIAGGLQPEDVRERVESLSSHVKGAFLGVDVQTGVEVPETGGQKDPVKVAWFIAEAKGRLRPGLMLEKKTETGKCLSENRITPPGLGLKLKPGYPAVAAAVSYYRGSSGRREAETPGARVDALRRAAETDVDFIHFDQSDGSITPVVDSLRLASELREMAPCLPYDLHVFSQDPEEVAGLARDFLSANPVLRVVHAYLNPSRSLEEERPRLEVIAEGLRSLGVGLALSFSAGTRAGDNPEQVAGLAEELGAEEIWVVGPSAKHGLDCYAAVVGPTIDGLRDECAALGLDVALGADREMGHQKTAVAGSAGASRVAVGKALLDSVELQDEPVRYRQALTRSGASPGVGPALASEPTAPTPSDFFAPLFLTGEDLVAKLRFIEVMERLGPYMPVKQSRGYYSRVAEVLTEDWIPERLKPALLTVFANVVYLTGGVLDDAWRFLWGEAVAASGMSASELAGKMHLLEVDQAGMAADFHHLNEIEGRLDADIPRVRDVAGLADCLLALRREEEPSETELREVRSLFTKSDWFILTDNALSGQSLKSELERYAAIHQLVTGAAKLPMPRLSVLIQVFTSDARAAVEAKLGKRMDLFTLKWALYFDSRFKLNSADSCLVTRPSMRKAVFDLTRWFAREVIGPDPRYNRMRSNSGDDLAFGFRGSGWTIVRSDNCPSDSVPLLWYRSPRGKRTPENSRRYLGPFPRINSRVRPEQTSPTRDKFERLMASGPGLELLCERLREVLNDAE